MVGFGQHQHHFTSEADGVNPVRPPRGFLTMLSRSDREQLYACQNNSESSTWRKPNVLDHFGASVIDVGNNPNHLRLMVVQATSCLLGAHNTGFWILSKKRYEPVAAYRKVFETRADGFAVDTKTGHAYPDLSILSHTAVEGFESRFKYSRGKYRQASCYVFPLGEDPPTRRIRCSQYNSEFRTP